MKFIHDETEVNIPKVKVITKVSKWDKYEYREINGKKYIKGYNALPESELYTFMECDNPNILIALLEMKTKLQTKNSYNQDIIANNLVSSDIALLLDFCKKWGLPMWGLDPTKNYCSNESDCEAEAYTIMRPVVPFSQSNYLYIPSFIQGLYSLYNDFLKVVVYNNWQNDININPLLSGTDEKLLQNICSTQKSDFKIKNEIPEFVLYMPGLTPFKTFWNDKEKRLQLQCENLIHLATYFLCLKMQSSSFLGGYIKTCKKCGQLFFTEQSRKLFCNNPCTRQAYYYIKTRNK